MRRFLRPLTAASYLQAVKELHRPTPAETVAYDCAWGECDHQDECPKVLITVCRECQAIALAVSDEAPILEQIEWPCATARAFGIERGA
ncbi:MAG: hypothetical protein ACREOS_06270 [Candidatus Dormibacteraceae bacterium]